MVLYFTSNSTYSYTLKNAQIRDFVGEQMSLRGIEFHTEESPQAILKSADGLLSLKTNKGTVDGFSHIMFATGRKPNTKVSSLYMLLFLALMISNLSIYYFV